MCYQPIDNQSVSWWKHTLNKMSFRNTAPKPIQAKSVSLESVVTKFVLVPSYPPLDGASYFSWRHGTEVDAILVSSHCTFPVLENT